MKLQKLILISALVPVFLVSVFAQTPPPAGDDGEVIKLDSRLVVVPVSVLDARGEPVPGLKEQDFRVTEEGRTQEVAQVSDAEKVPLEIALLLDISASTDPMFKFEQQIAAKFLQEVMRPEDRATIFTIGERPVMLQARSTSNITAVKLQSVTPTKQFTAFYDTVTAAAAYLQKNAMPNSRKVIIAISDGEDTNSDGIRRGFGAVYNSLGKKINTITSKELRTLLAGKRDEIRTKEQNKTLQVLQNADTVFYSVNPAGGSFHLNEISKFGQSNLQRFADETGGTAFLPKYEPINTKSEMQNNQNMRKNTEMLAGIFRQLGNELRAQYLLQYYSETDFQPNRYVKLGVGLANPQKLRVRARQGYFVKK